MNFPKWMYRRHPTLGIFQQTLVATAEAAQSLGADWSDDPTAHGFKVRLAAGAPYQLYEVVPGVEPVSLTTADIATVVAPNKMN